jgi:hypothetical protein
MERDTDYLAYYVGITEEQATRNAYWVQFNEYNIVIFVIGVERRGSVLVCRSRWASDWRKPDGRLMYWTVNANQPGRSLDVLVRCEWE